MVKPAKIGLPLLMMSVLGMAMAARADGVLEQMQREVAAIVRSTKSAVVSIEDERALVSVEIDRAEVQKQVAKALAESREALAEALREKTDEAQKERLRALQRALSDKNRASGDPRTQAEIGRALEGAQMGLTLMGAPKSGTGFCIGKGYVVTTADVLEGMKQPVVVTDDGTRIKAKVVGLDADLNVGLLALVAKADVPALTLGDSASIEVGHFAISIGNQSGQNNSVALTLVAGLRTDGTFTGRRFYPSLIQIAGTVGAGTSGAPLVNARGEVIGMMAAVPAGDWAEHWFPQPPNRRQGQSLGEGPNPAGRGVPFAITRPGPAVPAQPEGGPAAPQAKPPPPARAEGDEPFVSIPFLRPPVTSAGFAIPINDIKPLLEEMRSEGKIARGWIGISLKDEDQTVEEAGLVRVIRTVKIAGVYADSPAYRGGLQPGDILLSLDGKPVGNSSEVRAASLRLRPDTVLNVVVKRNGETQTCALKVEARPKVIKTPPLTAPIKRGERTELGDSPAMRRAR